MKILRRVLILAGLTLCLVSTGCDEDEASLPFAGYAWLPAQRGVGPVGNGSLLIIPTAATSTAAGGGGGGR